MASINFQRQDGGRNGRDGPTTDVVGGSMTIGSGICLNQDLSFGSLRLGIWGLFCKF